MREQLETIVMGTLWDDATDGMDTFDLVQRVAADILKAGWRPPLETKINPVLDN